MNDPVAIALKFGFLAVLYIFLLWVSRSSLRDLNRRDGASAGADPLPADDRRPGGLERRPTLRPRLEVIAAMSREPGETFDLTDGAVIGRAPSSDVRIEDPFASSAHARIFPRGEAFYVEDMGSTNGTYLNGRQLVEPQPLREADVIRIGESEYRYQE
ncbi:MAG: FHA domain-containing protein [Thermoleophilaceae bacterium]